MVYVAPEEEVRPRPAEPFKVLELFCGTKSVGIRLHPRLHLGFCTVHNLFYCFGSGGFHRTLDNMEGKTEEARLGSLILRKTLEIITYFSTKNPNVPPMGD